MHHSDEQITGDRDPLSISEIDARMAVDGFPEMALIWKHFRKLDVEPARIDNSAIESLRNRHMGAIADHPWLLAALLVPFVIWQFNQFLPTAQMLSPAAPAVLTWLITGLYSVNLAFLLLYLLLSLQRYLWHPLWKIMALDLAFMLSRRNFRSWFETSARALECRSRLDAIGINSGWDNPDYYRSYRFRNGEIESGSGRNVSEFVQDVLREFLGYKDEEKRKFVPGRYLDSLARQKKSVTEFVNLHQPSIAANKAGELSPQQGIALLHALAGFVVTGSSGEQRLQECIEAAEAGHCLTGNEIAVRIWQRDPWVDLTYQDEFYSSASLRGVKLVGRGPKGRIGTFGYLRNRSITSLDFTTRKGRVLRARLGAAASKNEDGSAFPVLFVDGVEGTNAVSPQLVARAIRDYALHCGFRCIVYNRYCHNEIPKRIILHMKREGCQEREMRIAYADASSREYLDSFAPPIEPFEYGYPRGQVIGYIEPVGTEAAFGEEPRLMTRLVKMIQFEIFWILIGSVLLCSGWVIYWSSPLAFIPFMLFMLAGIFGQLLFQRRSIKAENEHGG